MPDKKIIFAIMLAVTAAFPVGLLIGRGGSLISKGRPDKQNAFRKSSASTVQKKEPRLKKSRHTAPQQVSGVTLDSVFGDMEASRLEALARKTLESSDDMYREPMLRVLTAQWAMKDPEAVLEFAASIGRSDLLEVALLEAAKTRGSAALSLLDIYATDPDQRRYLVNAVYRGIALKDPRAAVQFVEQLPKGTERDEALYTVMTEWVRQDVNAVFDWMENAEVSPQLHNIYSSAMYQYIQDDPEQAADVIANMQACQLKTELANQSARQMAEDNITKAVDWALSLDEESQRQAIFSVLDIWASGPNPEEALEYVMSNENLSYYDELFKNTAVRLAYSQPDQLLAEIGKMQEKDQIVVAGELASAMSSKDPKQYSALLDSLPAGNVRDAALQPAMNTFRYSDPPRAFDLSQQFSSDFKRLNSMETTLLEWAKIDYESALHALQESDALKADDKELLRQRFIHNSKPNDYVLP